MWWRGFIAGVVAYNAAIWVQAGFNVHGRAGFGVLLGTFCGGIALWAAAEHWNRW